MWFSKKQSVTDMEAQHDSRVEVGVHKNATRVAIQEAKQVNSHLNNLLVENGITLKIYLSAGGHAPAKTNRS